MIRKPLFCVALALGASAVTTSAMAVTVTFGSGNDGLGGFTQTASSPTEIWTTQTDSVQYRNQDNGTNNSSFLGEFVLDRSLGSVYTITGVVTLTDGYADDNNRVGMYLFGDAAVVPNEDEIGALGLIFNTDDSSASGPPGDNQDDDVELREGIDANPVHAGSDRTQTTTEYAQDLFGTDVTFSADIAFLGVGGADIQIDASMTTADGDITTLPPVTLNAADYAGDYFGFVTRGRARNYVDGVTGSPEDRSLPWVMDYKSFSVESGPEFISGDANKDGDVNILDFNLISDNFFTTQVSGEDGDVTFDGFVDFFDFQLWKTEHVAGGGSLEGLNFPVPEPGAVALLGLGLVLVLAARQRTLSAFSGHC